NSHGSVRFHLKMLTPLIAHSARVGYSPLRIADKLFIETQGSSLGFFWNIHRVGEIHGYGSN
ncbi:MAG: hypothetical protein VXY53_08535, partial [Candidatus Thermoplasmatota archaeon]|nr:hypothetical protein [Candidatus Thermoplasmatota archaeon]